MSIISSYIVIASIIFRFAPMLYDIDAYVTIVQYLMNRLGFDKAMLYIPFEHLPSIRKLDSI